MPHSRLRCGRTIFAACVAFLAAARTGAASYDLSRLTPVPDDQQIPAGDFFRPSLVSPPTISPDGAHIAAAVSAEQDKRVLLVYDVKTKKYGLVGGTGNYDLTRIAWLNSKRLIYQVSAQKLYSIGLYAVEVSDLADPYPLLQYFGAEYISFPRKDREEPLVWMQMDQIEEPNRDLGAAIVNSGKFSRSKGVNLLIATPEVFLATAQRAVEDNYLHIVTRYPVPTGGTTVAYHTDRDGNLEFAETMMNGKVSLLRLDGDSWTRCPVDLNLDESVEAGRRAGEIVTPQPHSGGKPSALRYQDAVTGAWGDVICEDPNYDFDGYTYRDPTNGEILGVMADREGPHNVWFTDVYRHYQDVLNRSFPGLYVRILQSDDAQKVFLIMTYSDRQPPRYSWVDFEHRSAGLFKDSEPWIDPRRMQPETIMRFKTRDGKILDEYLWLPAGASKEKPAPLVVIPHGGPWVRDDWGYDSEAQFLVSRGFAVLKPNYRASTGSTWKFPDSDEWDFIKMSQDVTDATKSAIATGFVDRSRIAIMGGSFGGFLSLEGVVDEPSLYRCAVCISGVFDWAQLIEDKKYDYSQFGSPAYGIFIRNLGDPRSEKDKEKFDAIAPVRRVDKIKVPVFVTHGKEDPTADVGQSYRLIAELEKHGVPHETYIVGSEGHGMYYFSDRLEQYEKIEAFLEKNLSPSGAN